MLRAGQIIAGRYRLEATIEEGGMASIWRAVHVDLGHTVAVKFNTVRGPGAEAAAERFLREARVAAAVRHRHVIDVIDYGLTDGGVPFIVMEFLAGVDLGDRMGMRPPLLAKDFLHIVGSCLQGLAAVHEAGIVHRDIKPENIFLIGDADGQFPKLLDFGISRATTRASGLRSSVPTIEGILVGTPEYMSPEQARGLKDVDFRTDLYSMGAVAYEGLTGRVPFEAEAVGDLLMLITSGPRLPVSRHRPELGPAISEWVDHAMARAREDRFEDARAMRDALLAAMQTSAASVEGWDDMSIGSPVAVKPSDSGAPSANSVIPTLDPEDEVQSLGPAQELLRSRRPSAMETLDPIDEVSALPVTSSPKARRGLWIGALVAAIVGALVLTLALQSGQTGGEPQITATPDTQTRAHEATQADEAVADTSNAAPTPPTMVAVPPPAAAAPPAVVGRPTTTTTAHPRPRPTLRAAPVEVGGTEPPATSPMTDAPANTMGNTTMRGAPTPFVDPGF
ncbi:MAG: protein kinase [Myxococcales bacterium]|nr:protein kinase [Myxococcales bacterium]